MTSLKARKIFSDDERSVVVVESVDIRFEKYDTGFGVLAFLAPVATVILQAGRASAFDANADPVDLDGLVDQVPELSMILS